VLVHRRPFAATFAVLLVAAAIVAGACTAQRGTAVGGTASAPAGARDIVVYAAASLGDVFRELAAAYEEEHAAIRVVLSFDASNILRARIEAGAPADVFAAADTENAARLVQAGLTTGAPVAFARNELAIVIPVANRARIARAVDLARPGVRIVAAGEDVPITQHARELLDRLGGTPGAPADFVAQVGRNVVSREDNVRAVLAKVELGEADAGIVYRTDAQSTTAVRSIPIPSGANVVATYAAVAVARRLPPDASTAGAAASGAEFVAWLRSDVARSILARAGFERP
jgi:molybdate transport system substrate-binding protein